jgi:hypothetical protein
MGQNPGRRESCPYHGGFRGSLLPTGLQAAQDRDRDLSSALEGALCLLHGGDVEDVLQLTLHPAHPVGGGCGKSV